MLLGALVASPSPASAHAAPVGATPAPGSIVGSSPTEVTVTFSEPISPVTGQIQVIAPDGERINATPTVQGAVLRIPIRSAKRPLGTYLVSFRVISADSHPVGGAITFSVGAPSARPEAATTTGSHPSVTLAVPTLKFLGYAGITLIAGPSLFLAFLWPRKRSRSGAIRLLRIGLALTAAATLGALGTQAQQGSGAALWQVSVSELTAVLTSQFGLLLLSRLTALALLAVLLPPLLKAHPRRISPSPARTPALVAVGAPTPVVAPPVPSAPVVVEASSRVAQFRVAAVLLLSVFGLATWPLTGHAIAAPLPAVTVTVGTVHMAAMAVWLGGLITLTVFLLRGTDRRILGVLLPVWSRWAALAVVWLTIAGGVQAVVQLGALPALWQTGYGRLLLAKLAVLAGVLTLAFFARRLVTRVTGSGASGLRRTVAVEVAATVLILGLSAVLVQVDPGRSAAAKDGAVTGEGVSETLTNSLYTLQFNIYPVEVGEYNTVHAFLYTPEGKPLPPEEWEISTRLTSQNLEAVKEPLLGLTPKHHALGSVTFPIPGTYEIAFTIRVDDLNRATVKTSLTVP
ncbi:copper transport protein [Actinoplanes lutulentus]|uniref:Copper transport protein n=1 Tax=Actinoplanes lutulentus TaxID=1287878 RepID=A0A327Z8D5_9ACTN|nr:copper transport protein [Actinoplanes lutulentus]